MLSIEAHSKIEDLMLTKMQVYLKKLCIAQLMETQPPQTQE